MIGKKFKLFFILVFSLSSIQAEESFREYKTPQGQSFLGKAVGYEGQTIILSDKSGSMVKIPLGSLSREDQFYLVDAVKAKRIPKGMPTAPVLTSKNQPDVAISGGATGVDFSSEIMPILQERCNDCHNAPFEKDGRTLNPKAGLRFDTYDWLMKGFDGVDPVIIAGDTDASILFEVITLPPDDSMIMPPKGDPLTADQVDLFRRWILEGASEYPSGNVVASQSSTIDDSNPVASEKAVKPKSPEKAALRVGSFFAHIPVPLGVSPDEALAKAKGAKPLPGELIDFDRHVLPILEQRCNDCHHAPFDRSGRLVNPKAGLRFDSYEHVMKGNLDGPVVYANDLEKSSLYTVINLSEDDDLFMPPKGGPLDTEQIDIIKRWISEGAKPSSSPVSATVGGIPAADEPVSFTNHILPLFEERCMECHTAPYVKNSRTIKPRAGLRLDTYEWVLKGNLDGAIVSPGNHVESTLFQVITLDEDDPEIMPPKGDPLTEEQITMVKRWILEGAGEQPAATAADPNAAPKPKEEKVSLTQVNQKPSLLDMLAKRAKVPSRTQISGAEKTGALVRQLSERSPLVRAEFSSFTSEITDSALSAFGGIKNNISHLDVSRTNISDKTLLGASSYPNLTWLNARNTPVTDNGLKTLPSLQFLRYINLSGTKVTDRGMTTLAGMKDLEEIYLWNSGVSERGVAMLQKALPDTKIIAGL